MTAPNAGTASMKHMAPAMPILRGNFIAVSVIVFRCRTLAHMATTGDDDVFVAGRGRKTRNAQTDD
jgi:hypothetical protein